MYEKQEIYKEEIEKLRSQMKKARDERSELQAKNPMGHVINHLIKDPYNFPEIPEDEEPAFKFYQKLEKDLRNEALQKKFEFNKDYGLVAAKRSAEEVQQEEFATAIIYKELASVHPDPQIRVVQELNDYQRRSEEVLHKLKKASTHHYRSASLSNISAHIDMTKLNSEFSLLKSSDAKKMMTSVNNNTVINDLSVKDQEKIFKRLDSHAKHEVSIALVADDAIDESKMKRKRPVKLEIMPSYYKSNSTSNLQNAFAGDLSPIKFKNPLGFNSPPKGKGPDVKPPTRRMLAYHQRIGKICEKLDAITEVNKDNAKEVDLLGRKDQQFYDQASSRMKQIDIPESLKIGKTSDKKREIVKLKNMLSNNLLKQGAKL
jgi:hypothetical protein